MRAKTITDLLSLSVNLYLLSKDEDFLSELEALAEQGKKKTEALYDVLTGTEHGEEAIEDFVAQAAIIKKRLQARADEMAKLIYEKMHIAHSDEITRLTNEVNALKITVERTEALLNEFQQTKS